MKHTKGPWKVFADREFSVSIESYSNEVICDCVGLNKEYNANLIVAAPELLKVLKYVYENATSDSPDMWKMVSNAIDKAEGKKS